MKDEQFRKLHFDVSERTDDGAIPVTVSSEAPVEMLDGIEVLVHDDASIDLSRAPLPIIATHRDGQINVGIVDGLHVERGRLRGFAKFGERPEAAGYKRDVLSRIIRSVSVGYARLKSAVGADGTRITSRWMPAHVAMVAEPADVNAGFFRERMPMNTEKQDEQQQEVTPTPAVAAKSKEQRSMEDVKEAAPKEAAKVQVIVDGPAEDEKRKKAIDNLCRAFQIEDGLAQRWKSAGTGIEEVAAQIDQIAASRKKELKPVSEIGLDHKETRRFNMSRAILAIADNNWSKAGFELECTQEIAKRLGKEPEARNFFVPYEVQQHRMSVPSEFTRYSLQKRDLTVGTTTAGGFLVETANVGFIELLRNMSVLYRMGATPLSGLVGNVTIPRQSAAATAFWLATEATAITESQQTFEQVPLSPKTIGGYTEISRRLLLQSDPSAEGIVRSDLAQVLALEIDAKAINGDGTGGAPTGILSTSGIGSVTGTSLAYAGIIEFQTDTFAANALMGSSGYITTAAVAGLLKARVKFTSTASPLWDGRLDGAIVDGYPAMASNQMPAATMIFGAFSEVIIGEWGTLEVEVNPYANFTAGIVGVRAMASVDVGVRHPAAFSAASVIT